jgi:DNA replication protein DnaC
MISKAQVMALAAGDSWLDNGANLLMFGPPGGGKSHLAAALGLALVENGWRVFFARTTHLGFSRLGWPSPPAVIQGDVAQTDARRRRQ